jgi:hypothetical protein
MLVGTGGVLFLLLLARLPTQPNSLGENMETLHIEIDIDIDTSDLQRASTASGLSGEALIKKAISVGLKQLVKPKTVQVKAKANPDASQSIRLTPAEMIANAQRSTLPMEERLSQLRQSGEALAKSAKHAPIAQMTLKQALAEVKQAKREIYG